MNKWVELILGIILVVVPLLIVIGIPAARASWGAATVHLLEGVVVCGAILIGILLIVLGISDIKEAVAEQKAEKAEKAKKAKRKK